MNLKLLFGGAIAAESCAVPAISASPATSTYLLTTQMKDGARVVGAPKLTIAAGRPARIEVGSEPGDHYSISLTATPQSADTVSLTSTFDVVSAGIRHTASPTLSVAFGKPATIEFGEDSATSKPFRVDFTIDRTS